MRAAHGGDEEGEMTPLFVQGLSFLVFVCEG